MDREKIRTVREEIVCDLEEKTKSKSFRATNSDIERLEQLKLKLRIKDSEIVRVCLRLMEVALEEAQWG